MAVAAKEKAYIPVRPAVKMVRIRPCTRIVTKGKESDVITGEFVLAGQWSICQLPSNKNRNLQKHNGF